MTPSRRRVFKFGLLCALACLGVSVASGVAHGQERVYLADPDAPWSLDRFALIYSPELSLNSGGLGQAIDKASNGGGVHSLGVEYSTQTGWFARYHAQLDYVYGYGLSGVRIEPLGFGWAFPIVRAPHFRLEIEPLLSLADGIFLFTNDALGNSNVTFLLSSGAEAQINMTIGALYLFLSPVGLEVRYLETTSGASGQTTTGAEAYYRFRAGIGVQY